VTQGRIEDFDAAHAFDALTAFDVLEHVPNPGEFLANCRRLLRDGGRLAISVPNLSSWSRRVMRKSWYFYIPDGHLHYFTPRNLTQLLVAAGFSTVTTKVLFKAVTLSYSLSQLQELNPVLSVFARGLHAICPQRLASRPLPLPLGEILVIAENGATSQATTHHKAVN
jgi:2-polyprenyl-3-methyl-5-hydroxy-6-metoxy-1,4-benzoquinol methylase